MKILFVCRGNVGRSQIAEAIFNARTTDKHRSFSAGTWVRNMDGESMHGKKLNEFDAAKEVIASLNEIGIEASEYKRDQINEQMVEEAGIVVVMAEEHTIPEFLKNSPKVQYWEVEDPKGMNQEDTNKIRDQISAHVDELLASLKDTDSEEAERKESGSFTLAKKFLGKKVTVTMDRPLGTKHPKHGFEYAVNYGFIEGVTAPDGEGLDAYYLGVDEPLQSGDGICIAIAHRRDNDDDKLVVVPEGRTMSDEEIISATYFQEQWFDTVMIRQ